MMWKFNPDYTHVKTPCKIELFNPSIFFAVDSFHSASTFVQIKQTFYPDIAIEWALFHNKAYCVAVAFLFVLLLYV